jgi:tripartite-type tricarboxylate transporter receptor subunit TctC
LEYSHGGDKSDNVKKKETNMFRSALIVILSVAWLTHISPSAAQDKYPNRPVKIIVAFQAGQATDQATRLIAARLSEMYGQSFYVENRPGAASIIGTEIAAKAPADGYTLFMGSSGSLAVNPSLYKKLPYDPVKDFDPISFTLIVPFFLVANPEFPAKNMQELIAYLKAHPNEVNFGTAGSGASNHLSMELLMATTGVKMSHIPYKSSPAAVTDLLGGRTSIMFETGPLISPYVKAGRLNAMAVGSLSRASALPDLPTVEQTGFQGFEAVGWAGLLAPAGTPKDIIKELNQAVVRIIAEPGFKDKLVGAELKSSSPEWFANYIQSETQKWTKVVKDADVQAIE